MKIFRHYRFGFDVWGLMVFLAVMIPNVIWFAVPTPVDVLRAESDTPLVDAIGSVFQVLMVACLCCLINNDGGKLGFTLPVMLMLACILLYYAGWVCYYRSVTTPAVVLLMTLPPCAAFILLAVARKNLPALLFATGFSVCHSIFAVVNYL